MAKASESVYTLLSRCRLRELLDQSLDQGLNHDLLVGHFRGTTLLGRGLTRLVSLLPPYAADNDARNQRVYRNECCPCRNGQRDLSLRLGEVC